MDGIIVGTRHVIAAIGVDSTGEKHLMGLVSGSSENAQVVKDLLRGLIDRGLSMEQEYLFVIGDSQALRFAFEELVRERAHVPRCRTHELRNVLERLPKECVSQTAGIMKAAYKLPARDGMAKLKTHAAWLQSDYPDDSASLPHAGAHARAVDDQHHRESERCCAPCRGPYEALSRCRHGGALGGNRVPGG